MGSYAASKAAAWSATMGIRIELRAQGTLVVGVHFGNVDTDMIARVDGPKSRPADVVARVIEGIRAGHEEVLADARAVEVKTALTTDLRAMEATLQRIWDQRNSA